MSNGSGRQHMSATITFMALQLQWMLQLQRSRTCGVALSRDMGSSTSQSCQTVTRRPSRRPQCLRRRLPIDEGRLSQPCVEETWQSVEEGDSRWSPGRCRHWWKWVRQVDIESNRATAEVLWQSHTQPPERSGREVVCSV